MFSPSLFPEDLDHILAHTRDWWEQLRGRRLFVTGGTSFFGMWLIESFLWANDKLGLDAYAVVLSRDPASFCRRLPHLASQPALSFHAGSIERFDFPKGQFSHIIHAANAFAGDLSDSGRIAAFDRDVLGTRRVLEFARQCSARRLLFTSSGAVYGKQPSDLTHIPEDYVGSPDPMDSRTAYGQAKRVSEFLCAAHAREFGLETAIARCFAFVGPYLPLNANFAIGNFVRDVLASGPINVQGDGTPYRSYLDAADLAIWLWTILFQGAVSRPYNVGSETAITIADLARLVADCFQPGSEVRILRAPTPDTPAERYVPSTHRAEAELNLQPTIELSTSIMRTIRWHTKSKWNERSDNSWSDQYICGGKVRIK